MDRNIDENQLDRSRRRRWLKALLITAGLLLGLWAFRSWLSPSASARDFRMANVERGALESTIAATDQIISTSHVGHVSLLVFDLIAEGQAVALRTDTVHRSPVRGRHTIL